MKFRDKKSGAIYVVTTDSVLPMFQNDRYEVVEEKNKKVDVKVEEPKETLEVEETEEVKEVKKSKKK